MIQKSPAFSFYAKDFLTGTATMSLTERGAYVTLLAHEWDAGVVPLAPAARARVLGCTPTHERAIWNTLSAKFSRRQDGFINLRLEEERQKQIDRRQKLAENGSKGGDKTAANKKQLLQQEPQQTDQQNSSLASSSSASEKDFNTQTHARATGQSNGANAPGSLPRDHRFHAICSRKLRVCLTESTAAKLAGKWGGNPDDVPPVLQRFADALEALIGDGPKGDALWLEQHFESFMQDEGRVPVPAPKGERTRADSGVSAQIDAWGRDDKN